MLSVKNLTRKYKNGSKYVNAVDDITTHFDVGEFVFILGESGSGKSTLLNVLCGLDTDIEGSVEVDGIDTAGFSKKEWAIYRNHYVGFVFQEYNLIEHLNVWENVALPLQFQGVKKSEAKARALDELAKVGLSEFANKKPNQISGGQAQRVAIARALVTNPKVIMADEPTGALDTELGEKIIDYLKKVSEDRVVVVVTHDEDLAHKYATRIVSLGDGKIINDTNETTVMNHTKKKLDLDQPKMKLGMMFKFARNNVFSRMFRSIATSTVVSVGYISILLLSFLILGINTQIMDTVRSFIPEDVYQVYSTENIDITDEKLTELNNMDSILNARYDVSANLFFENNERDVKSLSILPVPYDHALITEGAELFGRFPENDNEIIISLGTAANLRGLSSVDEDSYEYIYQLVEGKKLDLFVFDFMIEYEEDKSEIGEYTIVGMIASEAMVAGYNGYIAYEDVLLISDEIDGEDNYRSNVVAYLDINNQDDIDAFTIELRDNQGLILNNVFSSITSGIEDFMVTALKIFIGVASISLIVSGILIGLVIYTSILERIKEIGILTAIGAKSSNIVGIFIIESGVIGILSSVIATLIGFLLSRMINSLFNAVIQKPLSLISGGTFEMVLMTPKLWIIGAVMAFSVIFSMLVGLIPSLHASRLNAVKALRRE